MMALASGLGQSETIENSSKDRNDLVAYWTVPLCDGVHTIEFEHGSTSGKRVLRVDGQEIIRREWMFKLVGDEKFTIGAQKTRCELRVDPLPHFAFTYSLIVDGKPLEKFIEKQHKTLRTWAFVTGGKRYRIVFEKQTLDVYVNGQLIESDSEFTSTGTEMKFALSESDQAFIRTTMDPKTGIMHDLYVDGKKIDEDNEFSHWKQQHTSESSCV